MKILEVVAHSSEGVGLADLCREVGLHSSTTFHLAKTLVTLGLLRQDAQRKRYRIGPTLFGLASRALNEIELLDAVSPFLAELARETGESSHVAILVEQSAVIIGKHDAPGSIRLAERVGSARPSYTTAIGKVLLSGMSSEKLDEYLDDTDLVAITPHTITDRGALKKSIAEVRRFGLATDNREFDSDVRCLASPVFDFRGQMIAAVGITGPVFRFNTAKMTGAALHVRRVATECSQRLGVDLSRIGRFETSLKELKAWLTFLSREMDS